MFYINLQLHVPSATYNNRKMVLKLVITFEDYLIEFKAKIKRYGDSKIDQHFKTQNWKMVKISKMTK